MPAAPFAIPFEDAACSDWLVRVPPLMESPALLVKELVSPGPAESASGQMTTQEAAAAFTQEDEAAAVAAWWEAWDERQYLAASPHHE